MIDKTEVFALYLPQFYETDENNRWWGKGYTDWTAAANALPIYEDHYQPHIPLNDNYYDLSDPAVIKSQAQMAKEFGIDGFCFYHYWFKDSQKVLEKPAEILLANSNIDIHFFFSWANATWARSWSNIKGSSAWANTFESDCSDDQSVLLDQKYGDLKQWKEHFDYLLPFFKDKRYLKINNKPVFMIHFPELMPCKERMIDYWTELALENGFHGLYLIGTNIESNSRWADASMYTMNMMFGCSFIDKKANGVKTVSYDKMWSNYLKLKELDSIRCIWCGIVCYDDTPRRGSSGIVCEGSSPELFHKYFSIMLKKSIISENPLVLLNAWNEWGEGMHLEPDERYGYDYLSAVSNSIKDVIENSVSLKKEYMGEYHLWNKTRNEIKNKCYMDLYSDWIRVKNKGKKIDLFFYSRKIRSICIYGFGDAGKLFCEELDGTNILLTCIIDRNYQTINTVLPAYPPEIKADELFDAMIVTVVDEYDEIYYTMKKIYDCPIISIEEVIYESMS